jgi:hypothetical protein
MILIIMKWWLHCSTTFVFLYSCIRASLWGWPECRPKHVGENFVNKMHHKCWSAFAGYLCILEHGCLLKNYWTLCRHFGMCDSLWSIERTYKSRCLVTVFAAELSNPCDSGRMYILCGCKERRDSRLECRPFPTIEPHNEFSDLRENLRPLQCQMDESL